MPKHVTEHTYPPIFISEETAKEHDLQLGDIFTYCGARYKTGQYIVDTTTVVDDGVLSVFKCVYLDMHKAPKLFVENQMQAQAQPAEKCS